MKTVPGPMSIRTGVVAWLFLLLTGGLCRADVLPPVAPETVGIPASALDELEPVLNGYITQGKAPGFVVLLAKDAQLFYQRSFGFSDIESHAPMRPDTLFWLASMTKPVTAVAVLQLVEQGRLQLDGPVSQCAPELAHMQVYRAGAQPPLSPPSRPMTIEELLTNTAGLKYGMGRTAPGDAVARLYSEAGLVFNPFDARYPGSANLRQMIEKLSRLPLAGEPGTHWEYSVAYDVLGYCVEKISGEPFDGYLRNHIFAPLGMSSSYFEVPEAARTRFATIYNAANVQSPRLAPNPIRNRFLAKPKFLSGGAGLIATAGDYLRFAQMLENGGELDGKRVLGEAMVAQMSANHLSPSILATDPLGTLAPALSGFGYGYGVAMRMQADSDEAGVPPGEYFWPGATNVKFWIDPRNRIVGVVLTQVLGANLPIDRDVKRVVYRALNRKIADPQ